MAAPRHKPRAARLKVPVGPSIGRAAMAEAEKDALILLLLPLVAQLEAIQKIARRRRCPGVRPEVRMSDAVFSPRFRLPLLRAMDRARWDGLRDR